ncbi:MAG: molybdopterin-guanine dinucleotide biosynthesis protein B [Chloroflexi bacterium]|nr:molybdopterin-guanine dinucleotide biosynthesis protein B [Chloroflexota bacterium]
MVPIISVVGKSDAGKTTFLVKLIPELAQRGYRVGVVKHDVHGFSIDQPGKDSWKLGEAGSDVVVISSPEKVASVRRIERERTLDEIALLIGEDVDIILTEGYKRGNKPKIEISRREHSGELLCDERELVALVTDNDFDLKVPRFGLDDATGVAELLEYRFLRRRRSDEATLLIDGVRVPMKSFVQDVLSRTARAIISTLHGTDENGQITLVLRRRVGGAQDGSQEEGGAN